MKKKFSFIISAFILLAVLMLVNAGMVVTYPDEYTIIKQFGKIESIRETPGLSVKIPFIQTEEKIQK